MIIKVTFAEGKIIGRDVAPIPGKQGFFLITDTLDNGDIVEITGLSSFSFTLSNLQVTPKVLQREYSFQVVGAEGPLRLELILESPSFTRNDDAEGQTAVLDINVNPGGPPRTCGS